MSSNTGVRIAGVVLLTLALIGGAAAVGYMAYTVGVAQGAGATVAPMPGYAYPPYALHPYGMGFLGCLVPLFFLFCVLLAVRFILRGPGWRGHGGPWGWHNAPFGTDEMREHWREKAEQWHREQHAGEAKV